MPLTGHTTNLPSDLLMDSGVLYVGNTLKGVTKGGFKFDPGWEIVPTDFDGRNSPIKGLDRKHYGEAVLSGTLLELGPAATGNQVALLEAGSASVDSGTTPNTFTIVTPKVGGQMYPSGDTLTDVRVIFERSITAGASVRKYVAIHFPSAIVRKWGPLTGANKDHPTIEFEIAARKDMAAGTTADAPYKIEYRESLPA